MNRRATALAAVSLVVVFSDVHLGAVNSPHPVWHTARAWHAAVKPRLTVLLGDLLDFAALKRFDADDDERASVKGEIDELVDAANGFAEYSDVWFLPGNHEARLRKALFPGQRATALADVRGLDLTSVLRANGLSRRVKVLQEGPGSPGLFVGTGPGRTLFRHGDLQAVGGKGGRFLAAKALRETPHVNQVFGHHHRFDVAVETSLSETRWAQANPCMAPDQMYARGGDTGWQRGWTVVQSWDRGRRATPHVCLADGAQVVWQGQVYG